jgi:hypothetical protein
VKRRAAFIVEQLTRPRYDKDAHGLPDPNDHVTFMRACRDRMRRALITYAATEQHVAAYERFFIKKYGIRIGEFEMGKDLDAASWVGARNTARARVNMYASMILAERQLQWLDGNETRQPVTPPAPPGIIGRRYRPGE